MGEALTQGNTNQDGTMAEQDEANSTGQAEPRSQSSDASGCDGIGQNQRLEAIAPRWIESMDLDSSLLTLSPSAQVIATQTYPRYGGLVTTRRRLGHWLPGLCGLCVFNTFVPWSSLFPLLPWLGGGISIVGIGSGLVLVVLLVSEVMLGAGSEIEQEIEHQGTHLHHYQFVPSLARLPYVLLFFGMSFVTLLFGFASFYAELVRHHPTHFSGLQDGFLSLYFALVTFSTVGYGDIVPVSFIARVTVVCEIAIAMFFSLVALSTTLSWVTAYERQQHEELIKQRMRSRYAQSRSSGMPVLASNSVNEEKSELEASVQKFSSIDNPSSWES